MGQLVFQATAGGQVALVGPNPSSNFSLNVPAVNGNLVTTGDTGTVTNTMLASSAYTAPGTIGSGTPNSGAFTTLSASSTVSGTGFSTYLASPPAIGGTSPSTGKFTSITNTGLTATQVIYATTGGLETSSANMTFNGTSLTLANDASISGLTVGKGGGSLTYNTALGVNALAGANTGSNQNTAVGWSALAANTSGNQNAAFGTSSLIVNTTGSNNSAFGQNSLVANTTGSSNTAVGEYALGANTTASNNTAVGYQAGYSNTTGAYNTFIGAASGYGTTTGTNNSSFGQAALQSNTTGSYLTAIGQYAMQANSTGSNSTAIGQGALQVNTSGNNNFAGGYQALASNTTASNNTAVGYQAGYSTSTGASNTFLGWQAGYTATGTGNCCLGLQAGYGLTTGTYNTFVGNGSVSGTGAYVTTGSKNTILGGYTGNQGGLDIRTASNYIVLSDGDGNPRGIFDNNGNFLINRTSQTNAGKLCLAFPGSSNQGLAINDSSNQNGAQFLAFYYGTNTFLGSITNVSGTAVAYNTTSDYRLKENVQPMSGALSVVEKLNPVTYNWKVNGSDGQGFIAHELQAILPDAVTGEKDAVDAEGNPIYQGIDTSFLVATLTAAIKELKAEFDAYKASHP